MPITTPKRLDLHEGQAELCFQLAPAPADRLFVIDIYSAESNVHPELHLGWWSWPVEAARDAVGVRLTYRSADVADAVLVRADAELPAEERWLNPEYRLAPLQQVNLIWYDHEHRRRDQTVVMLGVSDERLLQAYYAANTQRYAIVHPFMQAFHQRRLDVLARLFRRYIRPGSTILDIGSGHSILYLINGERWPYQITCVDLDRALIKQIAPERPSYTWMVAAAQRLPFANASFDALYAGEVIEHVPDGDTALAEWQRVLRRGGILIVTTPNRERLLNRINHAAVPVSPEHLVEFSCPELSAMFERNGFQVLRREGIYLELLALWRQRPPYVDPLTVKEPLARHLPALGPLMRLGHRLPQLAFDMVFVVRK